MSPSRARSRGGRRGAGSVRSSGGRSGTDHARLRSRAAFRRRRTADMAPHPQRDPPLGIRPHRGLERPSRSRASPVDSCGEWHKRAGRSRRTPRPRIRLPRDLGPVPLPPHRFPERSAIRPSLQHPSPPTLRSTYIFSARSTARQSRFTSSGRSRVGAALLRVGGGFEYRLGWCRGCAGVPWVAFRPVATPGCGFRFFAGRQRESASGDLG